MKMKIVVIDLELSRRTKRLAAAAVVAAIAIGAGAIAYASVPHTWNDGDTLNAADLNANFAALSDRLDRPNIYKEQNANVATSGDGNWIDVPGLNTGSFTVASATTVDIYTEVDVTAGSTGATECELRLLLDGAFIDTSDADGRLQVNPPYAGIPSTGRLTGFKRVDVTAGPHTVSVQIEKPVGIYANTTCVAGGASFPAHGRLRVQTN